MLRTLVFSLLAFLAVADAAQADTLAAGPRVKIDSGWVVGAPLGPAVAFKAIPYAAPPVGPLRWRPPQPPAPWKADRQAVADGPACPQTVNADGKPNGGGYFGPTSEDCLILDVFAPPNATKAPVMVWIFGGGNSAGADSIAPNDGRFFARDGVVLVAMNYRLGPLGFFAHPALTAAAKKGEPLANYGLMDQIAALKWVKRNIAAFGGDPDNVTVFGESAGGLDVLTLMVTPAAKGLFEKATVQSGGGWTKPVTMQEAETAGVATANRMGLPATATAAQLRALPVAKIVGAGNAQIIVDGQLVVETAAQGFARGHQAPAPLIIGSNTWEASLLPPAVYNGYLLSQPETLRSAYADDAADTNVMAQSMFTDATMGAPARWFAAQASKKSGAWLYEFSYVRLARRGKIPGANHTSENPYVFDTQMIVPNYSSEIQDADRQVAAFMHSCWVSFAKIGKPDCGAGEPAWPAYEPSADQLLNFDAKPAVVAHYRKEQLDAQDEAQGPAIGP
ncbi:MAG TPA: carboxylesterase family protein [Caulobacteraceae bacterium]|jgi:para-nitrobenzyl esterase|nr:carboxylesterase family protein [Caulobacteraceae bacterium]